jgi:hypothetical protein
MTDFVTRLAQRVIDPSLDVRPQLTPVFASGEQFPRAPEVALLQSERAPTTEWGTGLAPARPLEASAADLSPISVALPLAVLPRLDSAPAVAAPIFVRTAAESSAPSSASQLADPVGPVAPSAVAQSRQQYLAPAPKANPQRPIQPRPLHAEPSPTQRNVAPVERTSVKITIGRIDVRAPAPRAQPSPARHAAARGPQPRSLESYLGERNGRRP